MNSKYLARKTRGFDSSAEAARYDELCLLERAGQISELKCQPKWVLQPSFRGPDGKVVRAITYAADFSYLDTDGRLVVEDVKAVWKTKNGKGRNDGAWAMFRLKAKMLLYIHKIVVTVIER